MENDITQEVREQYEKLPEDVRRAINETDIRGILSGIVREHDLRVDQAGALENETLFVMLGLEHPDDFAKNLEENLALSREQAVSIARDVDQKLLYSVKQTLMNLHAAPEEAKPMVENIAKIKLEKPVHNGQYAGGDPYRETVE